MSLTEQIWVNQNGQTPNTIGICKYCVLDSPVFEWSQILLHLELTPWWSSLFADGANLKKPYTSGHTLKATRYYSHAITVTS